MAITTYHQPRTTALKRASNLMCELFKLLGLVFPGFSLVTLLFSPSHSMLPTRAAPVPPIYPNNALSSFSLLETHSPYSSRPDQNVRRNLFRFLLDLLALSSNSPYCMPHRLAKHLFHFTGMVFTVASLSRVWVLFIFVCWALTTVVPGT